MAKGAKNNPKTFHKYVNSRTKVRMGISKLQSSDSTAISDEEKASALNNLFSSVFTREDTIDIPACDNSTVDTECPKLQLSREDVCKVLQALNPSKSSGPDELHPKVLKETAGTIATPLLMIFQHSLDTGEVPSAWQQANVTAIFKKGSRKDPSNYRPVSLTSICCKVLEKFVRQTIVDHMHINNLLSNDQYGFRSDRSCTTQLLSVMEEWTELIDNEKTDIDTVYFDFRKAFDTVPHRRLLTKLKSYQISHQLLQWTWVIENNS